MRGHIRKDGKRWYAIIDIGRDTNGKRKQRWHGFATRREAEAALAKLVTSVGEGTYRPPSKVTVGEYLTAWFETKTNLRASTRESYGVNLRANIIPNIGSLFLRKLTAQHLDVMYQELLSRGGRRGKGLSPASVRQCHMIVHKALRDAVRKDILVRNVADQADPPTVSQVKAASEMARHFWTREDLQRFLASQEEERLHALWVLAASTGLRRGELVGLRWQDVDLDRGHLQVRRSVTRASGILVESVPKNGKPRAVPIGPFATKVLRRHKKMQTEERLLWGEAYGSRDLVFAREDGTPLPPDSLSKQFRLRILRFNKEHRANQLQVIRFHDIRHSHASLLLHDGYDIKVAQERLGHSSSQITRDIYSHLSEGIQRQAALGVDEALFGQPG